MNTIICSWCKTVVRLGDRDLIASHTCCEKCQTKVLDEITESTLSRENARELAILAGKLGQAHEEY